MLQLRVDDLRDTSAHLPLATGYLYDYAAYKHRAEIRAAQEQANAERQRKTADLTNSVHALRLIMHARDALPLSVKPHTRRQKPEDRGYQSFLFDQVLDTLHPDLLHNFVLLSVEKQRALKSACHLNMLSCRLPVATPRVTTFLKQRIRSAEL